MNWNQWNQWEQIYENIGIFADYNGWGISQIIYNEELLIINNVVDSNLVSVGRIINEATNIKKIGELKKIYTNTSLVNKELKKIGITNELLELKESEEVLKLKSLITDKRVQVNPQIKSQFKIELEKYNPDNSTHFIRAVLTGISRMKGNYLS